MTSKILFRDAVQAVYQEAFAKGRRYPVVLTLENHCSNAMQDQQVSTLLPLNPTVFLLPLGPNLTIPLPQAAILEEVLQDRLFRPDGVFGYATCTHTSWRHTLTTSIWRKLQDMPAIRLHHRRLSRTW